MLYVTSYFVLQVRKRCVFGHDVVAKNVKLIATSVDPSKGLSTKVHNKHFPVLHVRNTGTAPLVMWSWREKVPCVSWRAKYARNIGCAQKIMVSPLLWTRLRRKLWMSAEKYRFWLRHITSCCFEPLFLSIIVLGYAYENFSWRSCRCTFTLRYKTPLPMFPVHFIKPAIEKLYSV